MITFLKIFVFILIFYFGEVAISFSDKAFDNQTGIDDFSTFAVRLDNSDSDFEKLSPFDINIKSLIDHHNIKGASVAISRNERLVFAKGFGYANVENEEMVKPASLFRIASISKLITAVAVMKLFEENKISLDDLVFGQGGILPFSEFSAYTDARVEQITVRHLLNHTAGWSRHAGDPIFNSLFISRKFKSELPAKLDVIIRYALERNLNHEPGKVYSYSNLGYAILGEIISLKTGMPYEDYVIPNILKPIGLHDFHLGKSFYHQKFPNEVTYYELSGSLKTPAFNGSGELVPISYGGNNMELLGAAGGWIASAPELARFLLAVNPQSKSPQILKKETLEMMINPTIAGEGLFGWRGADKYGNSWRTGTLSGSTCLIMSQSNGISWVVLLNGSTSRNVAIHNQIAMHMYDAQKYIASWPEIDLFANASF